MLLTIKVCVQTLHTVQIAHLHTLVRIHGCHVHTRCAAFSINWRAIANDRNKHISHFNANNNKYSFIKTSDKPQMNTTATTGISDAGAAPVGTNYNVYR